MVGIGLGRVKKSGDPFPSVKNVDVKERLLDMFAGEHSSGLL